MAILFFTFGLLIGSFINVCIYRIPLNKSIINPPSSCGSCGHKLNYYDMLPVINYVLNKGKCRYCGEKYSIQYPVIELLNGILYCAIAMKYGLNITSVLYCISASIFIAISVIDLKQKIIPDSFNIALAVIGFIFIFSDSSILSDRLFGAITGFLIFFAIALLTNAMGGGDIKLMSAMGLIFGFEGISFIIFFSFVIGATISIALLILKIKSRKDEIPFGPFISAAALLYVVYGIEIINLYFIW